MNCSVRDLRKATCRGFSCGEIYRKVCPTSQHICALVRSTPRSIGDECRYFHRPTSSIDHRPFVTWLHVPIDNRQSHRALSVAVACRTERSGT